MLKVVIHQTKKRLSFSGDTFEHKETIKLLGRAQWNAGAKSWDVTTTEINIERLNTLFPNLSIEIGDEENKSLQSEADVEPPLPSTGLPPSVTVCDLQQLVREAVRKAFPAPVAVRGVIQKYTPRSDGGAFLDFADEERPDVVLRASVFGDNRQALEKLEKAGFKIEADLQALFIVRVDISAKTGGIWINLVDSLPEYTLGKLAALREVTNQRLQAEKIFDRNKKLQPAFLLRRLGIITSDQGTVFHDFISALEQVEFGFEIVRYHAQMQGRGAIESILRAFGALKSRDVDAVLIFRGGGSPADLAVFNEYDIAKTIALFPLPVFSAIGHQEDQSSTQDVSYRAFGVPKELGRFFADHITQFRNTLTRNTEILLHASRLLVESHEKNLLNRGQQALREAWHVLNARVEGLRRFEVLPQFARREIEVFDRRLIDLLSGMVARAEGATGTALERVGRTWSSIETRAGALVERSELTIKHLEQLIEQVRPERQLERGYAIVRRANQSAIVTRAEQVSPGDSLEVQFADDTIPVVSNS